MARIAEDEERARKSKEYDDRHQPVNDAMDLDGWHDPARVLAECEAKRQIVETDRSECGGYEQDPDQHYPGEQSYPCEGCSAAQSFDAGLDRTLRLLAQPYADHPDFDPAWRL